MEKFGKGKIIRRNQKRKVRAKVVGRKNNIQTRETGNRTYKKNTRKSQLTGAKLTHYDCSVTQESERSTRNNPKPVKEVTESNQEVIWCPPNILGGSIRRETNSTFSTAFERQLNLTNIKSAELDILNKIDEEIKVINQVIQGTLPTNIKMNKKIMIEDDLTDEECFIELVPRSKWIYETPDKQRLKKMEELVFKDEKVYEPAVLQNNKKFKTLYEINEQIQKRVDLNSVKEGQEVPINMNFLKPVCKIKKDEGNQFLENREESVNIDEVSVLHIDRSENAKIIGGQIASKKRPNPDNESSTWYEKQMKILATCRPTKHKEKISRRSHLQKKSLSFESDGTPYRHSYKSGRFISMDEFESSFSILEECDFDVELYSNNIENSAQEGTSSASPELSTLFGRITKINEIPSRMFYPKND